MSFPQKLQREIHFSSAWNELTPETIKKYWIIMPKSDTVHNGSFDNVTDYPDNNVPQHLLQQRQSHERAKSNFVIESVIRDTISLLEVVAPKSCEYKCVEKEFKHSYLH